MGLDTYINVYNQWNHDLRCAFQLRSVGDNHTLSISNLGIHAIQPGNMQGECTAFTERLYDGLWTIYRKTAGEFNLGWWHSLYFRNNNNHVPNHQPAWFPDIACSLSSHQSRPRRSVQKNCPMLHLQRCQCLLARHCILGFRKNMGTWKPTHD